MTLKGFVGMIATSLIVLGLVIGTLIFSERVPEGKVAVVYTPSKGASEVLDPGWHLIGPFEKTQQYPTRITIIKDKVSVTTNDGKAITMPVQYEMKVDASKVLQIFKELGSQNIESIQEGYLHKELFQASREVVSKYSVLDIYGTQISKASAEVTQKMNESTSKLGFLIADVVLGTPELDEETQKAIDERVKAAQQLEKLKLEKQIAESEAEKKRIEAEGAAAAKIEEARGTAEANRIINQSLTPELIKLKEAEARLKHGWVTVQGAGSVITEK